MTDSVAPCALRDFADDAAQNAAQTGRKSHILRMSIARATLDLVACHPGD